MTSTATTTTATPTVIGTSPGGVLWVAYSPEHVARMSERLSLMWANASARTMRATLASDDEGLRTAAQAEATRRESVYLAARRLVMRLKARRSTNKARASRSEATDAEYWAASERLHQARRACVRKNAECLLAWERES